MRHNNRLSPFVTGILTTLLLLAFSAITFAAYVYWEKRIDHANESRLQSFLLANKLYQTSTDLTRMARTYVETGEPIYKRHYQEIIDIREGKAPMPVAYGDPYWDLVLSDDRRPRPAESVGALLELMRQAGFTAEEFDKLQQDKVNSDALTRTEFAAMALFESTPATEAKRSKAIGMLTDAAYHRAKADIMRPIGEFEELMDQRTLHAVHDAEQTALLLRYVFIVFVVLLVFSLWRVYRALHSILGCSVDDLQRHIVRLGNGDFTASITVRNGMEKSVLGWLSATQSNLARIDADCRQSEERFRAAFEAAPNGMVIVDARGVIVMLNAQFAEMFGYVEHELIGQLLDVLLPEQFQQHHASHVRDFFDHSAKRLMSRSSELFGQHRDGRQIQIEVGLSPLQVNDVNYVLASVVDITARVAAAKQLQALSADLEATLQAIPDLLFEISASGEYLNLWARNPELLAAQKAVLLGHSVSEMLTPESAEVVMSALKEAAENGYSSGQLIKLDLPLGESWFELSTSVKSTTDSECKHFIMLSRDVTARKTAEQRAERIAKIYVALSQCNQAIMRCKDEAELFPILCRDAVNLGGIKMAWIGMLYEARQRLMTVARFGEGVEYLDGIQISMDASDPSGCGPTGTAMREDRPFWCQDFQHDFSTAAWRERAAKFGWGASASLPLHRHGVVVGVFNFYTGAINQFDDATRNLLVEMVTNVDYAIGVYENEVRRKLLEESLRNSEDKYRKAFQTSPDAINITRMQDGLFLDVNSGFERMFGFRRGEVIGKTSVELKVWRNPADRQRLLDALNQTGVCESLEADFNAKQGDVINGLMSGAIVHINGEDCIITMTRDITEQRRVLAALSNTADELVRSNIRIEEERAQLAQRVEERTLQLRLANKAKDSFLATMSHEIRTPLGGLLGMMELLGLSRLNSEQRGILAAAQQSGNSLLRIVNDILDWSKIEAGKLELAPSAASIAEMLKTVANTYSQIASENGISIEVEIDSRLSPAHLFDPLRVSQILDNFTSNALKFTEHGNVQLAAYLLTRHDGRETIRFSVRDSGVGISAEHQARLFQQYEQASAETARMYGGTGLGLAICRRLAELMGGTLGVESTVGVGSLFSLSVDLLVANPVLQPAAPDGNRALAADDSPLVTTDQSVTVLIVDDHPLNRMLLKQQLGMLGLRVEAAADGVEALSLWQNKDRHFDLIITDCHMPVMDGYDLTYRIRDFERQTGGKRIPIIAWTANVLTEEAEHCHAAGMDDLLTKPTELAELRAMLLKWLLKAGVLV